MADTIAEKIIANIETVLKTITTANGYNNTVKTVSRDPLTALDIQAFPAVFVEIGSDVPESGAKSVNRRTLNLTVEFWVMPHKNMAKSVESLRGDIQKALMVDPRRAGNAVDTVERETNYILILEEQPAAAGQIAYSVNYRTKIDDPFTAV